MQLPPALAAALLLGAGCFSTPGFGGARDGSVGDDGGSGSDVIAPGPVSVMDSGAGKAVQNPYLSLVFDNSGWRMPVSLTSKITHLDELSSGGHGETGLGQSFENRYSVARANDPGTANGHASLVVTEPGPVRVMVQVSWGGSSPCANTMPLDANSIQFAVYLDGRIVRHDVMTMTTVDNSCTQTASSYISVTGNRTLHSKFGTTVRAVNEHPNDVPDQMFDTTPQTGWACLDGNGEALGYSWTVPTDTPWTNFELARYASGNLTFGFIENEGTAFTSDTYVADTMVAIGQGSCDDMQARLDAYTTPPTILNAEWDPTTGAYNVGGTTVTANAKVPAGAVFILTNQSELQLPVTIGNETLRDPDDYLVQSGGARGVMLYLKRELMDGNALTFGAN